MKQSAFAQVLACVASAYAAPQFSIPFSIPTSLPTGLPFSIPTSLPTSLIPSIPLPTGLGGLSLDANVARTPPIPPVVTRQTGSDAENDVVDNTGCKEVTLIFARGSLESGNMGSIIGPPLYTSLQSQLGSENVAAQGVDYDASIEGNAELGANGGPVMANYTQLALSQCPDTAVVLAGYSQGAMVVHNAAGQLTEGQFKAVTVFGDPLKSEAIENIDTSKVKEYCAEGDLVCDTGVPTAVITPAHLTYGTDADDAASFLASATGV